MRTIRIHSSLSFSSISTLILSLVLLLLPAASASAQAEELSLTLRRDFGYGGMGGQIQGTFSYRVDGPQDLVQVAFYIDDEQVGSATEAPWRYQFKTDHYDLGVHELYAVGTRSDGRTLTSNVLVREFVPASQGWSTALKIAIPLILIALAAPILTYLRDRRSGKQTAMGYGSWGRAICPKCGYPFARHVWAPNLGVGKYDRCSNCGKWSMVRRATTQELQLAEAAHGLVEQDTAVEIDKRVSDEDKLREKLDASRYEDG
ncbi:MAG: hypothetical protein GY759_06110 [Chloroflexi bacterium]|nr:hypothetical protein [Chloroflexota bacterium]